MSFLSSPISPISQSNGHDGMKSIFRKLSRKENKTPSTPVSEPHPQVTTAPPTRRAGNTNGNPFREPPPAYSPAPPSQAQTANSLASVQPDLPEIDSRPIENHKVVADDAYSFLGSFDTIFLIDDSGSMAGGRWREASDALASIAPVCTAYDEDGIDICFLNAPDNDRYFGVKRADSIREIFNSVKPGGGTPTGQRLRAILTPYLRLYEANPNSTKPINVICITDGDAHDDVESPLIEAAKKLDQLEAPAWQVGVQFFQIGNDPEATELLQYLDDELVNNARANIRDIVDTVPYRSQEGGTLTGDGVLKVVLGSVNRRLDRRRGNNLHRAAPNEL